MASVHVCLTNSNSPSFTPSSSSFPSPVSLLPLFSSTQASSTCHSFPRLPGPAALIPLGPFCLSPPDSLSLFSPPFSLFSLLCVSHSHTRVTHPAAPPASSCSRPSFKTFPPSQSLSLLSIKASILPCSHLDGVRKLLLLSPQIPRREEKEGRKKEGDAVFFHPRTGCLKVQNTNANPTALQLFLMIYLLRGSLSAPKSSGR